MKNLMKSFPFRATRRLVAIGLVATAVASTSAASAIPAWSKVALSPKLSFDASYSTSGDYATDVLSDPWDFSNTEDFDVTRGVGHTGDAAIMGGGVATVATRNATEIRFLMNWPEIGGAVLPWGRDGWLHPIDADRYTRVSMRVRADSPLYMAVRWWNADDQLGQIACDPDYGGGPGCRAFIVDGNWRTVTFDVTNRALYTDPNAAAVWNRAVTRLELFRGGAASGGNPAVNFQVDWVRVHRADAPANPPVNVPIPRVLSPNELGGADYATVERGNAWDFAGLDDVAETHDVAGLNTANGDLNGLTVANDGFIGLALGPPINTDKYHRLSVDVCYDGAFDLGGGPGGGMMGRLAWIPHDNTPGSIPIGWSETQDIIVFPGCNTITLDLVTNPPSAVHDQNTTNPTGWRGVSIGSLRFDLNEDPGRRAFSLRNVRLADDSAFTSSFPITFSDAGASQGTTADIYVTTDHRALNGTRIATNVAVGGGVNTFVWNGTDARGNAMSNGTYWVYIVMKNTSGVGTGYSSGPVRLEKPVPPTPSYYVPLTPARVLDTRTGMGGNMKAINQQWTTELPVTGVGGVPAANVTAVVMNVTVTEPTGFGFVSAWPSGEPRPLVSSLNFQAGQTVPNLVTVKVGANGRVNLFNSAGDSHLVADISGYYTNVPPAAGGRFTPVTPARLLDTRDGTGTGAAAPIGQSQAVNLGVTGVGGVPASGVQAVALNVTATGSSNSGYLTVWPSGEAMPTASTHNFVAGQTVANMVVAKVGANGRVGIFSGGASTHVVADVIGYFSDKGGLFVPVSPTRVVDTRESAGLGEGGSRSVTIANGNPMPGSARAAVVNVTSVDASLPSYLTAWPTGVERPLASTLNPRPGLPIPNQAYLGVGSNGSLDLFNASGSTNVIVDVFGYFTQ